MVLTLIFLKWQALYNFAEYLGAQNLEFVKNTWC